MRRLRWLLAALGLIALMSGPARAEWQGNFEVDPDSGIEVKCGSFFDVMPPDGVIPVRVEITNHTTSSREWTLRTVSSVGYSQNRANRTSEQSLSVAAGQTEVFNVLVPLAPPIDGVTSGEVQLYLSGYGIDGTPVNLPRENKSSGTPFVAMGKELSENSWGPLESSLEKKKTPLVGTVIDASSIGEDWRGLLGVRSLWLSDHEYGSLSSSQRLVVRDWVLQGGEFFLCARDLAGAPRADFGAPAGADSAVLGFGRVHFIAWDGSRLPEEEIAGALFVGPSPFERFGVGESSTLASRVGALTWNLPLLSVAILLFAALVGPVNLFWISGAGRRHRMFWTTPLISLGASLVLGLLIVFQEGFGGDGARGALVYLDPVMKRAVTLQEQYSKTGVLSSARFQAPEIDYLTFLPPSDSDSQRRNVTLGQAGTEYFGDWFSTRWKQGQFAQAIRPSRAGVQFLPGPGEKKAEVLSSIPATLREIYLVDDAGHWWEGQDVTTGRKVSLRPVAQFQLHELVLRLPVRESMRSLVPGVDQRSRSFFYALADDGSFLSTLPSIRWSTQSALYLGPLTPATP